MSYSYIVKPSSRLSSLNLKSNISCNNEHYPEYNELKEISISDNQLSLKDLEGIDNETLNELVPPLKVRLRVLRELKKIFCADEEVNSFLFHLKKN